MNELDRLTIARRRFLQAALVTGTAALVPEALRFGEAKAASPVAPGEGILVLIMLGGGNDGLNMVAPTGDRTYQRLRRGLAVGAGAHDIGEGLALHPNLSKLKGRYDYGAVGVVRGVGYPKPNLSHFESMANWMSGSANGTNMSTGWVGRWLDTLPDADAMRTLSIGGSVPLHLRGANLSGLALPGDAGNAFGIDRDEPWKAKMVDLVNSYGDGNTGRGHWADEIGLHGREAIDLATRVGPIYEGLEGWGLARDMSLVARFINANVGVRVFSVDLGGFDTHSGQSWAHAELMRELDDGIDAFFWSLAPQWGPQVTVMTFSEFGRRPEVNDTYGTDHGTAAPLIVVGQSVRGGHYGEQPSLDALDRNGNLVSNVDFRQVYASMITNSLGGDADALLGGSFPALDLFRG